MSVVSVVDGSVFDTSLPGSSMSVPAVVTFSLFGASIWCCGWWLCIWYFCS